MNISKKITLMFAGFIVSLIIAFVAWQYWDYTQHFTGLSDYTSTAPRSISTREVNLTQIRNDHPETFAKQLTISITPQVEYEVVSTSDEEERLRIKVAILQQVDTNSADEKAKLDEYFKPNESNWKYLVVRRMGTELVDNTQYHMLVRYKKWNLFNNLLWKEHKIDTVYVAKAAETSAFENNLAKSKSSFGSWYSTYGYEAYAKERSTKCPFWELDKMADHTDKYDLIEATCDFITSESKSDTGEDITVKILSPTLADGKKAFQAELAKFGLKEGPRLRVTYTR